MKNSKNINQTKQKGDNMQKLSDILNNAIKKEEKRRNKTVYSNKPDAITSIKTYEIDENGKRVLVSEDKPEENKQYLLVGGEGTKSIANGNTWAESEIKNNNQGGA